jgi:hypothetical protein
MVDDHELAVIPQQIVSGARHGDSRRQEAQFQLPKILLSGAVGMRNQGMHGNSARDRVCQGLFDFREIETEDGDLHSALCALNCLYQRARAVPRLYQEFHGDLHTLAFTLQFRQQFGGCELEWSICL